jgi:hypothetical protein
MVERQCAIVVYKPRSKAAAQSERELSLGLPMDSVTHREHYNQTVVPDILRSEFGAAEIGFEESRI